MKPLRLLLFVICVVARGATPTPTEALKDDVMVQTQTAIRSIFPSAHLTSTRVDQSKILLGTSSDGYRVVFTYSGVSGEISQRQEEMWNSHFDAVVERLRTAYLKGNSGGTYRSFMFSKYAQGPAADMIPELTFSIYAGAGQISAWYRIDFIDRGGGTVNVVCTLLVQQLEAPAASKPH